MPLSLKWLDYIFAIVVVMLVFMLANVFITAYVVRLLQE